MITENRLRFVTLAGLVGLSALAACHNAAVFPPPQETAPPVKVCEHLFTDGVKVKVHYTESILKISGEADSFPREVLDAARLAYQTITELQGFSTPGYSFAAPDHDYAYDPDRTIDIYLGHPTDAHPFQSYGFRAVSLKDVPCFDTLKLSETQYQAIIFLPSNYREFIKKWESMNPSALGRRNTDVDLRGTLMHEMLHVVLFYYNQNIGQGATSHRFDPGPRKVDWYVEGLARYFETVAGARHDFFSQGFRERLPDKIRFSRGGSNYFMRYPDQPFTDLRYENALFWRFMDHRYGMPAIEALSRDLRNFREADLGVVLENVTGVPLKGLLKKYALSVLFKDFGLKKDAAYLEEVAKTRLAYKKGDLYLKDGAGREVFLGKACKTDWVGRWKNKKAAFGDFPVAGDNTEKSDVSGWSTDFYEVGIDKKTRVLPWLGVSHKGQGRELLVQAALLSKAGSVITKDVGEIPAGETKGIDLNKAMIEEGLKPQNLETIFLLITNSDPKINSDYEIVTRP